MIKTENKDNITIPSTIPPSYTLLPVLNVDAVDGTSPATWQCVAAPEGVHRTGRSRFDGRYALVQFTYKHREISAT